MALTASCPGCALGREVQRELWTQDLGFNSAAVLLPFVLVILGSLRWCRRYRAPL